MKHQGYEINARQNLASSKYKESRKQKQQQSWAYKTRLKHKKISVIVLKEWLGTFWKVQTISPSLELSTEDFVHVLQYKVHIHTVPKTIEDECHT